MSLQALSSLAPVLVWTFASGFFYTAGDILFRMWLAEKWELGFLPIFLIYMTGTFCMTMTFFHQNIAVATVAAILVNVIAYLIAAYALYGDVPTSLQIIGLTLGLAAIVILELA